MKELPYFRFTCQEWQNGAISTMSDSCKGVFADICPYYWVQNCNVSFEMLSEKFKTKSKTIQKLIEKEVIKCQNGIVSISFLNEQMSELNKNNKYFSDMGKLGQKAKKSKAPLKPPLSPRLSYKDKDKDKDKDIKEIIDYLNKTIGTKYRSNSEKTNSLIRARLKERFTLNDFKTVIEKKYLEWNGTDWVKYLRPETLFSVKNFEGYLNQKSPLTVKNKQKDSQTKKYDEMLNGGK